ncbi:hypothetical protein NP233_g5482 [Leucocoprinus birnbaumii]|uniref:mannan endo-1,4-beta-mannosidase n=1 Tax=Leucocoprinus birnbaumii TaxID=56174 RepID=A0AAD5VZ39_9AGAR|nr:hypothetical protein NP233_g5482 [Leucocoprinus birnbaumii]
MRSLVFSLLAAAAALTSAKTRAKLPKGFATTNGANFEVDGKPFAFVGANSYWLPLLTTQQDVETTFKEMQAGGVKVVRTWGFNAINGSELAGAIDSGLTYYQVWNSSEWILNPGPRGLQRLDHVVETAGKYGIKLILAFTNNWVGYGGMELYINWIAGAGNTHDVFYTDKRIIASFQRYVRTIVNRYKNSPNIFAWEMMNEARCLGDLPAGPECVPGSNTLHTWYEQQSNFVRSLDPFHMITTGGEGHFYWKGNGPFSSDYNYNGQAGEDFDLDLQLENIDFGTYVRSTLSSSSTHNSAFFVLRSTCTLRPGILNWTSLDLIGPPKPGVSNGYNNMLLVGARPGVFSAIRQALIVLQAAKKANKPLILEEFGLSGLGEPSCFTERSPRADKETENKTDIYPAWVDLALQTEHGIMPWQFGALGLKESRGNRLIKYADAIIKRGFSQRLELAIYQNQTALWNVFRDAAVVQARRSR